MSLNNFFSINFPYGLQKAPNGNWQLFNRSYVPLGWHTKTDNGFSTEQIDLVSATYKGLSETLLKSLAVSEKSIGYDTDGKIFKIMLYDDSTVPTKSKSNWDSYVAKLNKLSRLDVDRKKTKSNQNT